MSSLQLILLPLLLVVEVQCQTAPYVSFMGQTLADHSYVDISQVGTGSDAVYCHTDLTTCCSGAQGPHRGDWYFPNGIRLEISGGGHDIFEVRTDRRVDIRRINNANEPTGIYRCDIPTFAVHHPTDNSVRDSVYVGLYTSTGGEAEESSDLVFNDVAMHFVNVSGDITIMGDEVTFDSDQLTLTCISTGGPATTVTWTRDSTTTVTEGTETVLDDPETAQYTHTLTVTTGGEYTCTVENNKPSSDSATITVPGIYHEAYYYQIATKVIIGISPPNGAMAVQHGPTSITVTWTASSDATGYRISYTGGEGSSGTVDVDGGNTNSHTLMGLTNGETYTISIMGTASPVLPSAPVEAGTVGLSKKNS